MICGRIMMETGLSGKGARSGARALGSAEQGRPVFFAPVCFPAPWRENLPCYQCSKEGCGGLRTDCS